jgi:hypothetical protein
MSNGTEGMLRGQAPDAFQKVDPSMPRRSKHDTEFERMPVKPQKSHANSTGFTSQCAGLATDGVMEQAITDKLNQTMADGIEDGWNAREELEAEEAKANKEVTQADIEAMEDKKKSLNDDDDDLEALRARRRQQMKDAHDKRLKYQALGHGSYDEIEEDVFLKTVCASPRCVVHFYHKQFEKCKVIDMHLRKCAKKFFGTKFVRLDAEKSPFFVEKLQIKTLPCAVVFNDGIAKGRQLGYEGLGDETFKTVQLAWRIKMWEGLEEDFGPEDELNFD